ncbi:MAG: hypothetical protein OEY14_17385 [Myxococcales bacterium]|nr:hypothetical protein [Myxococcales bacterium]
MNDIAHPYAGISFEELIALPRAELEVAMQRGFKPTAEQLAGWEFRGFNPPIFARLLGFQKFIKGFFLDDAGKLAGYNLFPERPRGGPKAPWIPKAGGVPSTRHGFYDVEPVPPRGRYADYPDAVLLNYGSGRNSRMNPEARIRDFLVCVEPGSDDLFLGKAFIDLGAGRVFSNFFILERLREAPRLAEAARR